MKKKILIIALSVSALGFAQKTWVTGSAPVRVEPRTLFYNGDGFEVSSADAIVSNRGNIQVDGADFAITNNATFDNFFMDWSSKGVDADADGITDLGDDGYGQLIINEAVAVSPDSKIALEKETVDGAILENAQMGMPFSTDDNLVSIMEYSLNSDLTPSNSGNRLYHPFYKWNNQEMRWDRKNVSGGINAWEYYIIRKAGGMEAYNNMTERIHLGTPHNAAYLATLYDHSALPDLESSSSVNIYNEVYKSYIEEYFDAPGAENWGKFQYQYGNAYTSNLDLSYIGFDEEAAGAFYDENGNGVLDPGEELNDNNNIVGLIGVYKVVAGAEVNPVYGQEPNTFTEVKATALNGAFQAGDKDALLVKPLEGFVIKTDGTPGEFNFNDGIKTFAYSPKVVSNPMGDGVVEFRTTTSSQFGNDYYQLRLNLVQGDQFINKTYVVAQSQLENGIGGDLEAINVDLVKGISTKEEVSEGEGVDPTFYNREYYINQINTDYMGIRIPLYGKGLENGASYRLDFDLCLGVIDLPNDQLSYENPNAKYFFHDIYTGDYFEINHDSNYEFVKTNGDNLAEGGRFELFFGSMAENLGSDDIDASLASTQVYNNSGENYVRFDKSWSKANIYIYSAVGQIIFMQEDVDTSGDFLLPLNNSNVTTYIVQVENTETGESISKKVVK